MIIAVDFDGTLVDHRYPDIGKENPGAVAALQDFKGDGAILILWTMRSGKPLEEAMNWAYERGIVFDFFNDNPGQRSWTASNKAYANLYIDDAAAGCPLLPGPEPDSRPWVNWVEIQKIVRARWK